jgi:hypothetical protein
MRNPKKFSLLIFAFVFLLLPSLLALAAAPWQPSGPPCLPEDDFNPTHTQSCEYRDTGTSSPREIRLKWNIVPSGSGAQFCALGCTKSNGTSCTGAMFKDNNGFSTSTPGSKLFPKDDIKINDQSLSVGNTYQTFCCALKDPSQRTGGFLDRLVDFCQTDTLKLSQKMLIIRARACFENSFTAIVSSLNSFQPTTITEVNFKKWADTQPLDDASNGGSGESSDLKDAMIGSQCTGIANFSNRFDGLSNANTVLTYLKNNTASKNAVPLVILVDPTDKTKPRYSHLLIFLGITSHNADYSELAVKLLDSQLPSSSQAPGYKNLSCAKSVREYGLTSDREGLHWVKTPGIFHPYMVCSYDDGEAFLLDPTTLTDFNLAKLNANAVRKKTAEYLSSSDNFPPIKNFLGIGGPFDAGICAGWTDFVLKVAYLGNFVGKDCHPDGTLSQIEKKQNSWLANAWSAWYNIFK